MRITDPDGRVLEPFAVGEIRVRAPQLCLGYVDSALDAGGVDGGGVDGGGVDGGGFDDEGFFRTGDLAYLDDDGYLVISGRLKDIIIRKGENISAKEVEDILYAHPAVADAAVIGLPDADRGELACAVVIPKPGAEPLTMDAMAAWCGEHGLMTQKIPERLEIVTDLPRNSMGKVVKYGVARAVLRVKRDGRGRHTSTGSATGRRTVGFSVCQRNSRSGASRRSGNRVTSERIAISPSSRASAAPKHTCAPAPNVSGRMSARVMSNRSGCW